GPPEKFFIAYAIRFRLCPMRGAPRSGQTGVCETGQRCYAVAMSAPFGPFSPTVDPIERVAQLRCLPGLVAVIASRAILWLTNCEQPRATVRRCARSNCLIGYPRGAIACSRRSVRSPSRGAHTRRHADAAPHGKAHVRAAVPAIGQHALAVRPRHGPLVRRL